MSTKLHNRIQTHIDNYNGEIITTDGKPPVNAKLTNFKLYGKSVQSGTPTPENPVPIESVPSDFEIVSCGANIWRNNRTFPFSEAGYNFDFDSSTGIYTINGTGSSAFIVLNTTPLCPVKSGDKITMRVEYSAGSLAGGTITIGGYRVGTPNRWVGEAIFSSASLISSTILSIDGMTETRLFIPGTRTFTNLKLKVGWYLNNNSITIDTPIEPYTGSTTNLNLIGAPNAPAEWVGQPISLMSAPDGTSEEYRADEGVIIKKIAKRVLNGGVSETYYRSAYATWDRGNFKSFFCNDLSVKFATSSSVHMFSSRFQSKSLVVGRDLEDNCIFSYGENNISYGYDMKIDKNLLSIDWDNSTDAQRITAFRTWLASNNVEVIYDLNEPITIPVIPQPTPKSVYAHLNNIYADTTPQPTISCGIRKLGNRPYIQAKLKDELGNFLADENGNNIGGLY